MASVEGRRGMPRPRPPFPAVSGLFQKPTHREQRGDHGQRRPTSCARGPRASPPWAPQNSKGTKVFALTGKITNPGLVEVPMGITLREIVFDIGGGIPERQGVQGGADRRPVGRLHPRGAPGHQDRLRVPEIRRRHHGLRRPGGHGRGHLHGGHGALLPRLHHLRVLRQVHPLPGGYPAAVRDPGLHRLPVRQDGPARRKTSCASTACSTWRAWRRSSRTPRSAAWARARPTRCSPRCASSARSTRRTSSTGKCPAHQCKGLLTYAIDTNACTGCTLCAKQVPHGGHRGREEEGALHRGREVHPLRHLPRRLPRSTP